MGCFATIIENSENLHESNERISQHVAPGSSMSRQRLTLTMLGFVDEKCLIDEVG